MDGYLNSAFSLRELLNKQIPDGLDELANSANNLERVAAYCEANYAEPGVDKARAFRETKALTMQSLAGVAYQVNQVSSALLRSLELESESIASKMNDVTNCDLEIAIQKEKAARLEIGKLTLSKQNNKTNKITYPSTRTKTPRHVFTELDFNSLDDIGHPAQDFSQRGTLTIGRNNSMMSTPDSMNAMNEGTYGYLMGRQNNPNATLTRKAVRPEVYRIPQMPVPSSIPDGSRYSTVTNRSAMLSDSGISHYGNHGTLRGSILPPPSQPGSISQYRLSMDNNDALPPPPNVLTSSIDDEPLPPAPMSDTYWDARQASTPTEPDWAPPNYLAKTIAIYDYDAQKPDELNLRENSVVYVVAKNDDGWFEGVMDGMTGLFPSNYVQTIYS
uniref:SH3 domain-containing protein n=1 Tax=Panagrellus redivivus TaxID=6233 RepID=A0A7E4W0Y0_PANRE